MIKVGIIGVGGYAGQSILSILLNHPEVSVSWIMSEESNKGKKISERYPHLTGFCDLTSYSLEDLEEVISNVDVVFLSLPHGISIEYVPKILKSSIKVVDLGADYRFNDEAVFKKWYNIEHKDKSILAKAVFGLPEIYGEQIKKANLVGNPGCYPTASILGLAPLIKNNLIDLTSIVIDAKSGISGAGRGATLKTHFCERNEGITAYSVNNHRHMGEINYHLGRIIGKDVNVTFVPHLTPMNRGILATAYARMTNDDCLPAGQAGQIANLLNIYKEFYKEAPFVRIFDGVEPNTKNVAGTNYCDIGVSVNCETKTIIVMSAIDNLIKGAAGQAVQNMNLMFGLDENTGLKASALYP